MSDRSDYLALQESATGLREKIARLPSEHLPWYEGEVLRLFGLRQLPPLSAGRVIQQALPKSPGDRARKILNKTFYVAHAVAYLQVMRDHFGPALNACLEARAEERLLLYNTHRLLQALLFDSLVLLDDYLRRVKAEPGRYGVMKSPQQGTFSLYQAARQAVFGQSSCHAFVEIEADLAISLIRQLIELRLRRGFGVLAWYQEATDQVEPLTMGVLFEVLKGYRDQIGCALPLEELIRLYGWANQFLHAGLKEYAWTPLVALEALRPLMLGPVPTEGAGWNLHHGLVLSAEVLAAIRADLERRCKPGQSLITMEPQARVTASGQCGADGDGDGMVRAVSEEGEAR